MTASPPKSPDDTGEFRAILSTGQHQAIKVVGQSTKRISRWGFLALVLAAVISYLVVAQLRGPDPFRQQLGTESEGDLARILASLSTESSDLQQETGSLKVDLANLRNSASSQGAASAEQSTQLKSLQVLAGSVAVHGPGIALVIDDPSQQMTYDVLVDSVQELRDAGAEALTINGKRIGARSSFGVDRGTITLDGSALKGPYTLSAIGPADTMEGGLKIPGGALDTLRALSGVRVDEHRVDDQQMPALEQTPTFHAARPVGSAK